MNSTSSSSNRRLLIIMLCSLIVFGPVVILGEHLHGWDAPTHIFFSSSYVNNWWNTWELRWYGGYSTTSYPPLAHQITALTTFIIGNISTAYGVVTLMFLVLAPIAVYRFSRCFVNEASSLMAALIFILLPSTRSMVFGFGQFAGFISLIFMLLSISDMTLFMRHGRFINLVAAICMSSCCVASHHATAIFLLPLMTVLMLINEMAHNRYFMRVFFIRTLKLFILVGLCAFLVIVPFWIWISSFRMQIPIDHASRENLLFDPVAAKIFFWDIYGFLLFLAPLIVFTIVKSPMLRLLGLVCIVLSILGLGGTTPLPKILFGKQWEWLTFERFSIWATVISLPLVGYGYILVHQKLLGYLTKIAILLLTLSLLSWLLAPAQNRLTPPSIDLQPVLETIAQNPSCKVRYLALGFSFQLPDISTYSNANTLDGLWHTARSDELLLQSGIGSLSDALYFNNGYNVLDKLLSREEPIPAYCIFINELSPVAVDFKRLVVTHGWEQSTLLSDFVSFWTNRRKTFSSTQILISNHVYSLTDYIWGILPISFLITGILAYISRHFLIRKHLDEISRNH